MTTGSPPSFVLREVHVLDEAGGFGRRMDVLVEDGRIAKVGPGIRTEHRSIDTTGLWLMPGIFDCHNHLSLSSTSALECLETPVSQWALETANNARKTLEAGVTFVRDAGGVDLGMRESFDRGYVTGPRVQIAVVVLSQTAGHMDGFLRGIGLEMSAEYAIPDYPGRPPIVVDGPDEMRRAVRAVLRAGADWVKICTTGGIMSAHDDPLGAQFTPEEIAISVYEAARRGKHVMSHAFGGEGLDNAVEAGVKTIEHGIWMTEEQGVAMAREGTWLVPTLAVQRDIIRWAERGEVPLYMQDKAREMKRMLGKQVPIARAAGVKIAVGSDYVSREEHGTNLDEIVLLCEAGMPLHEVLLAATVGGAELCGVADKYGRIAEGYVFDAVLLGTDPSRPQVFGSPSTVAQVYKGGEPVIRDARTAVLV
jgi:imidazolonepropionase-like amidohydrolase